MSLRLYVYSAFKVMVCGQQILQYVLHCGLAIVLKKVCLLKL